MCLHFLSQLSFCCFSRNEWLYITTNSALSCRLRRLFSSLAFFCHGYGPSRRTFHPEELRDELTFEIHAFLGDLKGLGYAMDNIPGFVNDTFRLPMDTQIQKLRKQLECMRRLLEAKRAPSNSPSALLSASAPSNSPSSLLSSLAPWADAWATYGQWVNKRKREENSAPSGYARKKRVSFVCDVL